MRQNKDYRKIMERLYYYFFRMDLELEFLEFYLGIMESKRVYIVKKERKKERKKK